MNQSIKVPIKLKRRHAAAPTYKIRKREQENGREKTNRAGVRRGAHNSLPCCVSVVPGKARKTAIYPPRLISSRRRQALSGCLSTNGAALELAYFNNLAFRLITPQISGKGH